MADTAQNEPPPGTLNYVEGQVALNGEEQTPKSIGSAYLGPNQQLETGNGYAEVLLTPGIYLRVGHNSAVTMIDPGLADTQVQLTKGSAMLEVDELFESNRLSVIVGNSTTLIGKQGLYEFTAEPASVKVLNGEAALSSAGNRNIIIKKGHEVLMSEGERPIKKKFDKAEVESSALYRWSNLRADYATEANVNEGYALMDSGGWWGPGWYWNPVWSGFAFMPGWGIGWGPWGFPFFSPWAVAYAPFYGFHGYGPGFYHYSVAGMANRGVPPLAHSVGPGSAGFRALPRSMAGSRMMGGFRSGGFRGGFDGGFRGGMGGFGGGFHGGGHGR